ncbi:MAG: hypothetical protein RLZZ383_1886 [Pseudomonadota bacterium]|jgi:hypothetical protein
MALSTPKSESVREDGTPDGWSPPAAFLRDVGPGGQTQLVVSVPTPWLGAVHRELVAALAPPLGLLYRQVVDRRDPQPQGAPPRDFVGLEMDPATVGSALLQFEDLLYHDARCELWVRGAMNDQIILDADGLMYLVPDDPAFEDVLRGAGLSDDLGQTIRDRDYAKHWFHAPNDALEDAFLKALRLTEVPSFKAR